jgi:dihydropteroate synthase
MANKTSVKQQIFTLLADGRKITYEKTKIMGILNVTEDSFYETSRITTITQALKTAERFLKEGADILDIGGESTRPGAEEIEAEEEIRKTIPVIRAIKREFDNCIISIDTYKAATAEAAIDSGADIVNDISGMRFDPAMVDVVSKYNVPVIIMHIQGTPRDMQKNPRYDNVIDDLKNYFSERIEFAESKGIERSRIIIDPGFGFGKTVEHNLEIIRRLPEFFLFNVPVLLGVSRKSTIGKVLNVSSPEERLEGTLALTAKAVLDGVHIVRVHDVLENHRVIEMLEAVK